MNGNLFVVSRLGQLRNVQSLITQYGATRNHLAVIQTQMNPTLNEAIQGYVSEGLFDEVSLVTQPDRPLVQGRRKNRRIRQQIEELLVGASEAGVENLFLCNVDNYYGLFERINSDRSLGMSLNLLEEGLGTYINAGAAVYDLATVPDLSDVQLRASRLLGATLAFARAFGSFIAETLSWVVRVDLSRGSQDLVSKVFVRKADRYGPIRHFDNAYVYFPERIDARNLQIDRVHPLGFVRETTAAPRTFESIEDGATVVLSQKYLSPDQYLAIVVEILSEMGESSAYFKFHPRENRADFSRVWESALASHPDVSLIAVGEIQSVPAEELVMAGKVGKLIGLTSTSLMYTRAFFEGVEVLSIGSRFRQLAESPKYGISERQLAEFDRDLAAFLDVSDVPQF